MRRCRDRPIDPVATTTADDTSADVTEVVTRDGNRIPWELDFYFINRSRNRETESQLPRVSIPRWESVLCSLSSRVRFTR